MRNFLTACDGFTMALSTVFGLSQIETIVGVVVLGLQGILLLSKLIYSIVQKVKNKDYKGAIKDVEDVLDKFEQIQEDIKNHE